MVLRSFKDRLQIMSADLFPTRAVSECPLPRLIFTSLVQILRQTRVKQFSEVYSTYILANVWTLFIVWSLWSLWYFVLFVLSSFSFGAPKVWWNNSLISEDCLKMVRMNSLADALRCINNAEKRGKRQVR